MRHRASNRHQAGNGDDHAEGGVQELLPDADGQIGRLNWLALQIHLVKDGDEAEDSAEQSSKGVTWPSMPSQLSRARGRRSAARPRGEPRPRAIPAGSGDVAGRPPPLEQSTARAPQHLIRLVEFPFEDEFFSFSVLTTIS